MFHPDPDFTRYCATGNEAAFRGMVTAHLPMVLGVAARRLGPHAQLAPDVAQAVFTRLARVAKGLPPDLIVASWLHRQAVRLAIDAVRHEERRLRRETTAAMLHAPDSTPPPATETARLLDEALDQLPASDRSVLVLRYLEDRDFESVARSLGSTPEAARKRIARSLEKLRALLARRGVMLGTAALTGFLTEQSSLAAMVPPAHTALSARISSIALKTAAVTSNTAAIFTTALMSHATALSAGALAALLACGLFYQQRETEISTRTAELARAVTLAVKKESVRSAGSSTAQLPQTLPEIIAALIEITDGPDTRASRERIAVLLRRVPPEQYLEFYVNAEPSIHPLRWHGLVSQSIEEWVAANPSKLTVALFESDSKKLPPVIAAGLEGNFELNSLSFRTGRKGDSSSTCPIIDGLAAWLKVDAPAARKWIFGVKDTPLARMRVGRHASIFNFMTRVGAQSMADVNFTDFAALAGPPSHVGDWRESWAESRLRAGGSLGGALSRTDDPDEIQRITRSAARKYVKESRSCIAGIKENQKRFAASLGMVAQYNLESEDGNGTGTLDASARLERADFALKMSDGKARPDSLEMIVGAWFEAGILPSNELKDWLLKMGGRDAAKAIATGAKIMAGGEPWALKSSMEWAAAIPDPTQRGALLRGIFLRWFDAEPAKAQKFLVTAPAELTAELKSLTQIVP